MMITAPDTLVISSKDYGAYELKKIIRVFTLRGFYYVMAFLILCIIAVFAFSLREKKVCICKKREHFIGKQHKLDDQF